MVMGPGGVRVGIGIGNRIGTGPYAGTPSLKHLCILFIYSLVEESHSFKLIVLLVITKCRK
jgi:hypothetical protein